MKDLERMFTEAVQLLIEEGEMSDGDAPSQGSEQEKILKRSGGPGVSKIDKTGATGSGGFSSGIINSRGEAMSVGETLASPSGAKYLMEKMGITTIAGADDLQKATSVILQAVSRAPMSLAFQKPVFIKEANIVKVPLNSAEIDVRNAIAYLHLTLVGAVNAGFLKLKGKIKFVNRNENVYGAPAFFAIDEK